jgi:anaerobic ribonucleoside-triphosphate reductase activating protein
VNYATIKPYDIANGPGVRVSLFISGCRRKCPGCFNEEAWDFGYGQKFTDETMVDILKQLESDNISGLSILGGDPLEPENINNVTAICVTAKLHMRNNNLSDKSIWLWSGYSWNDVKDLEVMRHIDVMVDGPFIQSKKNLSLAFRGSSNQRIIDVQKSLEAGEVVLWEGVNQ